MVTCRSFLFTVITVISVTLSGCRSTSTATADTHFERGEYFEAQRNYRKAYNNLSARNQRKRRGEIALRLAACYTRLNRPANASAMLRNALRYGQDSTGIYLRLAQSLHDEGKYADALGIYNRFISIAGENDIAAGGIAGCRMALDRNSVTRYRVRRADMLNMHRSDHSPAFAGKDFSRIYFTSTNEHSAGTGHSGITGQKNGDIWMSDRNELNEWTRPEPAEGYINSPHDEGTPAFTPDGQTMYFTRARQEADRTSGLEIWVSRRSDALWSEPEPLEIAETGSLCNFAHPAVSPDGRRLYFSSDMPGGSGGYDLWMINLEHKGTPVNLGDKINTPGDEVFPVVRDDSTLYFSSDGHPGFGGLDIFKAVRTAPGNWKVSNMYSPINSSSDDFGIVFTTGECGYFSSNRGDTRGYDHIYEFRLPQLDIAITGHVDDTDGYAVSEAMIRIVGDDGSDRRNRVRDDGSFGFRLDPGIRYAMLASAEGYLNARQEFKTDTTEEDALYEVGFTLAPVGHPIVIDNIFYDFDKATLRPESRNALDSLAAMMRDNPTITVELSAHTDRIGSDTYNIDLSLRRARSVVGYLVDEAGIDPRRLTAKGYGKSRPMTVTPRLARQFPPFVEGTSLTPGFIESLTSEQERDTADQINRRTEFEITSVDFY
ncbi:MAG: OmpA family protein [Muribaculaceae bacterium]|nr:OmpA family protein [Muribaculaceae bacterium]